MNETLKNRLKVVVMGASGRTGKRVALNLLKAGVQVRALGREAGRLDDLLAAGAEVLSGDPESGDFVADAFAGADAAYTLLPYDVSQPGYRASQTRLGEAIVTGIQRSGVPHVVFVSSLGADQPGGTGMIDTMGEQERRLQALVRGNGRLNVLCLRAGSFMENFHGALPVIRQEGILADSVRPNEAIPMIAACDIADAASAALMARNWSGFATRELLGERDLSYAEATRILGEALGLPQLPYVQLPYDDLGDALCGGGFAPDVATLYVDIARAINEGRIRSLEGRQRANTTPTRFEDFASGLAAAYAAQAPLTPA